MPTVLIFVLKIILFMNDYYIGMAITSRLLSYSLFTVK